VATSIPTSLAITIPPNDFLFLEINIIKIVIKEYL